MRGGDVGVVGEADGGGVDAGEGGGAAFGAAGGQHLGDAAVLLVAIWGHVVGLLVLRRV